MSLFRHILFDLDNTLYPSDAGLWEVIGQRITSYVEEVADVGPKEAFRLRKAYVEQYGTTLNGLRQNHKIDTRKFLAYVHDVPISDYLEYVPELDYMLDRLPYEKAIFTNADEDHATRVLKSLRISQHFRRIIDICALDFVNKPDPLSYRKALEFISAQPEECVLVEDSISNLLPARDLGITTVLVGGAESGESGIHHIRAITDLESLLNILDS